MSASDLSDESLLRYYDAIRKQVEADRDSKHKLVGGDAIKEYAESFRLELQKRRLPYTAIDWSADQQANTPSKSDVIFDRNPEASAAETAEAMAAEPVEAALSRGREAAVDEAEAVQAVTDRADMGRA